MTTFVADSTDFQTTLDNAVSLVTASLDVIATRMGEEGFSQQVTDLVAIRDEITTQVQLEKSNIVIWKSRNKASHLFDSGGATPFHNYRLKRVVFQEDSFRCCNFDLP